jgi:hypothetical protein
MKLSEQTLAILKNYSDINEGIFIQKGNILRTVAPSNQILAEATVTETFPRDFGIYDLRKFISLLSSNAPAEIEFFADYLTITGYNGRMKTEYGYTDPSNIKTPPDKKLELPSRDVEFLLTDQDFSKIKEIVKTLSLPMIGIQSDGDEVFLSAFDNQNKTNRPSRLKMDIKPTGTYNLFFSEENLKILSDDYNVAVSNKGFAEFIGVNKKVKYAISLHKDSKKD